VQGNFREHAAMLREGRFVVASFHPELTDDTRVHELFLDLVREGANVGA
jgi:5'-phosphate synthase pdxT subunit